MVNDENNSNVENNELINQDNNSEETNSNMSTESLTVDYNNLYKLEEDNDKKEKIIITKDDIKFDSEDHIEDQSIIDKKDKEETKKNLVFMIIILLILIVIIIFVFPLLFKSIY